MLLKIMWVIDRIQDCILYCFLLGFYVSNLRLTIIIVTTSFLLIHISRKLLWENSKNNVTYQWQSHKISHFFECKIINLILEWKKTKLSLSLTHIISQNNANCGTGNEDLYRYAKFLPPRHKNSIILSPTSCIYTLF